MCTLGPRGGVARAGVAVRVSARRARRAYIRRRRSLSRGETRASVVAKAADILTRLARARWGTPRGGNTSHGTRASSGRCGCAPASPRDGCWRFELVTSLGDGDAIRSRRSGLACCSRPRCSPRARGARARRGVRGDARDDPSRERPRESSRSSSSCRDARRSRRRLASAAAAALKGTPARGGGGWRQPRRATATRRRLKLSSEMKSTRASPLAELLNRPRCRRRRRDDARASRRRITLEPRSSAAQSACPASGGLVQRRSTRLRRRRARRGSAVDVQPTRSHRRGCRICTPSRIAASTRDTDCRAPPASRR